MTASPSGSGAAALSAHHVECLLMAVLAVNNYSLEKAWKLLPCMREAGLTDPAKVAALAMPDVIRILGEAGYHRGNLNWMFAERVQALMLAIAAGKLAGLPSAVKRRDREEAERLLVGIRGVGPRVRDNAWTLLVS